MGAPGEPPRVPPWGLLGGAPWGPLGGLIGGASGGQIWEAKVLNSIGNTNISRIRKALPRGPPEGSRGAQGM